MQELNSHGEIQTREVVSSYEDAYTAELREVWGAVVEGRGVKTTAEDALGELRTNGLILGAWRELCLREGKAGEKVGE